MNSEKNVRNFYEEEAEYEKSILITKELINKVAFLNVEEFKKKIEIVDSEKEYEDFIDLFLAVTGRKTNKYYCCNNIEDVKYHGLQQGQVYRMSDLDVDIQSRNSKEEVLDLEARGQLSHVLYNKVINIKNLFSQNIKTGDGNFSTIETVMILESDIEYLDNLLEYLELMNYKTGRLKVLVAERDIYSYEAAKEEYNKKTSVEKLFHKIFNTKKSTIESMANKKK